MASRTERLLVRNLRSVGAERVTVRFPESGALVLLGDNNAGKSNITTAWDILFGDTWPGSRCIRHPVPVLPPRGRRAWSGRPTCRSPRGRQAGHLPLTCSNQWLFAGHT